MAKKRALSRTSGRTANIDPTSDTLDVKINVSGPNKILWRTDSGEGGHQEGTIGGLAAETTPAAGHLLLAEVLGVLKKIDVGDLPGGGAGDSLGTGFTAGGGSGTIPDGTVADFGDGFSSLEWSDTYPSGFLVNQIKYSDGTINDYAGGAYLGAKGAGVGLQFLPDEGRLIALADNGVDGSAEVLTLSASGIAFKAISPGDLSPVLSFSINESDGCEIQDFRTGSEVGVTYRADYSETIITNPLSIPDVRTVKKIARKMAFLGT
jgi:hypothetical protein